MMLEIRERINYVVLDKEQEKAYTSDSEAMLLLTPLCLERNVDKIGEMILKNNQDKLLDMESVFETSGQTVYNGKYRRVVMKKTGIKMLILNKERKSYDKLYQGFGICSKGKDMNIYFDGRGHCIQLTEGQIMLLKMIRQLSSSNDDITLAYNLDEKVFQLVTLWEREYVLNQEGKEIIISEDEMQRVTEMFNQRNLVRKKEID